jgi:membrane associated rhomboid family serine protease/uncharacterized protein YggT (Ycf19 family)
MIPIADSAPARRTPWVTATLVGACVAVFIYELTLSARQLDLFMRTWGVTPRLVFLALAGDPRVPAGVLLTLFTSQFLHGGWLHLIGNMVFLWVFGRAVEDRLGHLPYLATYLLGGAAAALVQLWVTGPRGPQAMIPLVGASGAIATVLGIYFVSFPLAWVRVLVPIFLFFFWEFDVPALLLLGLWFLGQFLLGAQASQPLAAGNVAVWAHVAGFVFGAVVGLALPRPRRVPARRAGAASGVGRAGVPGPVGLITSVAELAVLALAARAILHLLLVQPGPYLLGQLARLVYRVTDPLVLPFEALLPVLQVDGLLLDLPAIGAIIAIYVLAGLAVQTLTRPPRRQAGALP